MELFPVNRVYGLGYWLKDYGYYPKALPLCTYMDHGINLFDDIDTLTELNNSAPLIFKFSPRTVAIYQKVSTKPAYCLLNPFIHYKNKRGIEKAGTAKGSLFFPAHSLVDLDLEVDWENFVANWKLPQEFYPVDICIHPVDMEKGLDKVFKKMGYNVLCAGPAPYTSFIVNFYNIIKNYKYSFSNTIGSYSFYSVEMGIPFSLYGDIPKEKYAGNDPLTIQSFEKQFTYPTLNKGVRLFSGIHTAITPEQLEFVEFELGKKNTISRATASFLLYKSLFIFFIKNPKKTFKCIVHNIFIR